jgi:hypothetical protein
VKRKVVVKPVKELKQTSILDRLLGESVEPSLPEKKETVATAQDIVSQCQHFPLQSVRRVKLSFRQDEWMNAVQAVKAFATRYKVAWDKVIGEKRGKNEAAIVAADVPNVLLLQHEPGCGVSWFMRNRVARKIKVIEIENVDEYTSQYKSKVPAVLYLDSLEDIQKKLAGRLRKFAVVKRSTRHKRRTYNFSIPLVIACHNSWTKWTFDNLKSPFRVARIQFGYVSGEQVWALLTGSLRLNPRDTRWRLIFDAVCSMGPNMNSILNEVNMILSAVPEELGPVDMTNLTVLKNQTGCYKMYVQSNVFTLAEDCFSGRMTDLIVSRHSINARPFKETKLSRKLREHACFIPPDDLIPDYESKDPRALAHLQHAVDMSDFYADCDSMLTTVAREMEYTDMSDFVPSLSQEVFNITYSKQRLDGQPGQFDRIPMKRQTRLNCFSKTIHRKSNWPRPQRLNQNAMSIVNVHPETLQFAVSVDSVKRPVKRKAVVAGGTSKIVRGPSWLDRALQVRETLPNGDLNLNFAYPVEHGKVYNETYLQARKMLQKVIGSMGFSNLEQQV